LFTLPIKSARLLKRVKAAIIPPMKRLCPTLKKKQTMDEKEGKRKKFVRKGARNGKGDRQKENKKAPLDRIWGTSDFR